VTTPRASFPRSSDEQVGNLFVLDRRNGELIVPAPENVGTAGVARTANRTARHSRSPN